MSKSYVMTAGGLVQLNSQNYPGPLLADDVNTANSTRGAAITLTASATPHASTTWTQLDASLSADCGGLYIRINAAIGASTVNTSVILQIGIGAGGAETVWAEAGIGYCALGTEHYIPGFITSGTRVTARIQGAVASETAVFFYSFLPNRPNNQAAPITYGVVSASSRGTTVTAPGSLNTKGAWLEFAASTASDICAIGVFPQMNSGTAHNASGILIDIGVGAASSETVVIPDIYILPAGNEVLTLPVPRTYEVDIPAGSRIAARYARASTSNSLDLILVCATKT